MFAAIRTILAILAILTCETQQSLEGRRSARKGGEAVKGFRKRDRRVLQCEPLRNTNTKYKHKMKYKHKKIQATRGEKGFRKPDRHLLQGEPLQSHLRR